MSNQVTASVLVEQNYKGDLTNIYCQKHITDLTNNTVRKV